VVSRKVTLEKPPRTIYSLTAFGENIIPALEAMCELETKYLNVLDMETNVFMYLFAKSEEHRSITEFKQLFSDTP